jgi:hypothetical protein
MMRKANLIFPIVISFVLFSCNYQFPQERNVEKNPTVTGPLQTITSVPASLTRPLEATSPKSTSGFVPPTLTPLPPIPTEKFQSYLSELMENNGGCRLPCLWGIVPGETSWDEASQFLATFSYVSPAPDGNNGYTFAKVESPIEIDHIGSISYSFRVIDGIVESIEFYNWPELSHWHYLSNILSDYGLPDEVGLYTEGTQYTGSRVSSLILFYRDLGFMIEYVSFSEVEAVGDKVLFCPEGNYGFSYMWSKELDYAFDEAVTVYPVVYESASPRRIGEVSHMNIHDFYSDFREQNANVCIETDLDAWDHFLD